MMSATFAWGFTYYRQRVSMQPRKERSNRGRTFSKFGFTKVNHCLMMPSISRPRSLWSRNTTARLASPTGGSNNREHRTYSSARGKCLHRPHRKSWDPTVSLGKPYIRAVTVHLHVHQLDDSGVIQRKDALEDKDVGRVDISRPVKAGVLLKGIYGDLGTLATVQGPYQRRLHLRLRPENEARNVPGFEITEALYQRVEVNGLW